MCNTSIITLFEEQCLVESACTAPLLPTITFTLTTEESEDTVNGHLNMILGLKFGCLCISAKPSPMGGVVSEDSQKRPSKLENSNLQQHDERLHSVHSGQEAG